MEVFNQRLEQEYNASVIVTAPTVPYKAILTSAKLIKVSAQEWSLGRGWIQLKCMLFIRVRLCIHDLIRCHVSGTQIESK